VARSASSAKRLCHAFPLITPNAELWSGLVSTFQTCLFAAENECDVLCEFSKLFGIILDLSYFTEFFESFPVPLVHKEHPSAPMMVGAKW